MNPRSESLGPRMVDVDPKMKPLSHETKICFPSNEALSPPTRLWIMQGGTEPSKEGFEPSKQGFGLTGSGAIN